MVVWLSTSPNSETHIRLWETIKQIISSLGVLTSKMREPYGAIMSYLIGLSGL